MSNLRDLGSTDHLSTYELLADGNGVVLFDPNDESYTDLLDHPGAGRIQAVMRDILGPFTNMQGGNVVDLYRPRPNIEVDPEVQGGYPVISGTRIEFDLVASLVNDGVRPDQIKTFYPSVSREAAIDAVEFSDIVERYRNGNLQAVS